MKKWSIRIALLAILAVSGAMSRADATDDLFKAIDNKDVNAARAALDRGAPVNAVAKNIFNIGNITPLSHAVTKGQVEIVKLLLERGADVNYIHSLGGGTCLTDAAMNGSASIVSLLLDHGAKVDIKDETMGYTPLMYAASGGRDEVVKLLLDHGAAVDMAGDHAVTALQVAASVGSARLLLDHGAYVNAQDDQGVTALQHTAASNNTERLRLLLDRGAELGHADKSGWTALFYATRSSTADNVQLLLSRGAKWSDKDSKGNTPFYYAQSFINDAVIKVLVQAGANGGRTPEPVATALTAADRGYLAATCQIIQDDIDVIPQLDANTRKFLLSRVALRDCSLLKGFVNSRNYYRKLNPNATLPMPPAGWDSHYLTETEFKKYSDILDNAPW